jgi:growth arrest and DNA-damage-inducible protein
MTVLRKAQTEKRLTCGLFPVIKLLEVDPERALFCIMPQSSQGNATLHIQTVLLQAFCYENDINIIQVHNRIMTFFSYWIVTDLNVFSFKHNFD